MYFFRSASAQNRSASSQNIFFPIGKRSKSFGKFSKCIFSDRQALKIVRQVLKMYFFRSASAQNRSASSQNVFFPIGKRSKSFGKFSKFIFFDRQALKIVRKVLKFIFID